MRQLLVILEAFVFFTLEKKINIYGKLLIDIRNHYRDNKLLSSLTRTYTTKIYNRLNLSFETDQLKKKAFFRYACIHYYQSDIFR